MLHLYRCLQFHSEATQDCIPFSVVFVPDLVQICAVELARAESQGVVAQEIRWLYGNLKFGLPL